MQLFKLTLAVYLSLCCGCFYYHDEDRTIMTCMKDYKLGELTSTSHRIKAEATVKPIPKVSIESEGNNE